MEPELELVLMTLAAFALACGLFYGTAFVIQRIRLLWLEIESHRIDVLAKRASVKIALDENDLKTQVIRPDENGLLPSSRAMIDNGLLAQANMQAILAYIDAQRTHAPVPHSLTYSPHLKQDRLAVLDDQPTLLEVAPIAPKDFFQLYEAGSLPSNKLLLGFDMDDGQPVNVGWGNLYSCLIGGLSGMGKSTLIRNLLAQSALQGGRFVVLDPHYASGEESLGASLAPLQSRMLRAVAHDDKTMAQALKFLGDVGRRRLEGKDKDRTPLVLVVDECTALLSRGAIADQLIGVLEMIAQETRKVNVFALCVGQNFSAEVMKSTARNSFVSMISCRARRSVARIQSDSPEFGQMAAQLDRGQVVWMAPSGEIKRLAVANCTQAHLESVGAVIAAQKGTNGTWHTTGVNVSSNPSSRPKFLSPESESGSVADDTGTMAGSMVEDGPETFTIDAQAERALAMFYSGSDLPEAIQAVYGVAKSGRTYQNISRMLQTILRTQGRGNKQKQREEFS